MTTATATPEEIAYLRSTPADVITSLAYEQTFKALDVLDQFVGAGRLKGSSYGLRRDAAKAVAAIVERAWLEAPVERERAAAGE